MQKWSQGACCSFLLFFEHIFMFIFIRVLWWRERGKEVILYETAINVLY